MKIAVVGGTGAFGTAVAIRLRAAGYEVVDRVTRCRARASHGGRDRRRGRDERRRRGLGRPGRPRHEGRRRDRDGARAARGDRDDARAVGRRRASLHAAGRPPDAGMRRRSRSASRPSSTAPVVAGLHSLAASNLGGDERAGRGHARLRRRRRREGSRARGRRSGSRTGRRSTPARSRAHARSRG